MPRANYIPARYHHIWRRTHDKGIVGTYGLTEEQGRPRKADEAALRAQWTTSRIRGLAEVCKSTQTRVAALLGLNKKTFENLRGGQWIPSAALCRRMALLEQHAADGLLFPQIVPQRSEMRRRLILFRAWWFSQKPKKDLPEVELKIRVRWGSNVIQSLDLPVTLLPRMKLVKWSGLAELAKEITAAARRVSKANGQVAWRVGEEEFWRRYATDTLPAQIAERIKKHSDSVKGRKKSA